MKSLVAFFVSVLMPAWVVFSVASAADFRVDNDVRSGSNRSDTVKSTVFFIGQENFISQIGDNGEITFYNGDVETPILTLLDPVLRIQCHLDAAQTRDGVDGKRRHYESHREPLLAFVAQPKFKTEFDRVSGDMSLQSPWFEYKLSTESFADAEILKRYLDFCDKTCYLNFRINPASPLPLVRLEVNNILRRENRFPKSIEVSFYPRGNAGFLPKEFKATSSHKLVRRLDGADNARIEQVMNYRRIFAVVPFDEYQKKMEEKKPLK